MKHFWTKWAVLLISIIFLSSCGGSTSSTPTGLTPEGISGGIITPVPLLVNTSNPPINIKSGQVGNTSTGSKSYYAVTVPTTGTYTIILYGLSADADLWVYNYLPFDFITGPDCKSQNGGTANEQCTVTANSGDTMNIEVDGQYSLSGATYSISLIRINPIVPATACGTGTCIDFESTPPTFTLSGTVSSWVVDNTTPPVSGVSSFHSNGLTDSQTSCFSYTAATTSTIPFVSFNLMTNSTLYYDLVLFYIDNTLQLPVWSGPYPGTWKNVMFNTSSGTHTYKWCHSHTGSSPSGAVWVDDIYIQ